MDFTINIKQGGVVTTVVISLSEGIATALTSTGQPVPDALREPVSRFLAHQLGVLGCSVNGFVWET